MVTISDSDAINLINEVKQGNIKDIYILLTYQINRVLLRFGCLQNESFEIWCPDQESNLGPAA